jgi:membrane protein YqaA with SNARE-associated domain
MPPKGTAASPRRAAKSPARSRAASPAKSKSPARAASPAKSKSPSRPRASSPAASKSKASVIEAKLKARQAALNQARAGLGLRTQPLRTSRLFLLSTTELLAEWVPKLAMSKSMFLVGYPLLAGWLLTHNYSPELYQVPGCGDDTQAAGALFFVGLAAYEVGWWLLLGILSSIGFGSGLHSGIMFLWPFVMQTILTTETCNSTDFISTYNHPCALQCAGNGTGSSFFGKLLKVLPAAIVWGIGTALGELPPYFVTRAAKRAGKRAGEFEEELADAQGKTDLISKMKVYTIDFTEKHGFFGVYLLASWPNAAFDMCGMACGWLEMPFWTFLGATILGKGFTKVTIQCMVCITVFSKALFDGMMHLVDAMDVYGFGVSGMASKLRGKVMSKFELQKRFTADSLLKLLGREGLHAGQALLDDADGEAGEASVAASVPAEITGLVDQTSLAQKYCAMGSPPVCGEVESGSGYSAQWTLGDQWEKAQAAAARVMADLDADGSGTLNAVELEGAQSRTDGKLSLASIDPGEGGLLSLGNVWNGFIAALVLFFVVTIVEQVAKARQDEANEAELQALEASLKADGKKNA